MAGEPIHLTRSDVSEIVRSTEACIAGLQRDGEANAYAIGQEVGSKYLEFVERWHDTIRSGWGEDGRGLGTDQLGKLQAFVRNLRKWQEIFARRTKLKVPLSVRMTDKMVRFANAAVATVDGVEVKLPDYLAWEADAGKKLEELNLWGSDSGGFGAGAGVGIALAIGALVVGALAYRGATRW